MIDERMEREKHDDEYINRYGLIGFKAHMITLAQPLFYRLKQ